MKTTKTLRQDSQFWLSFKLRMSWIQSSSANHSTMAFSTPVREYYKNRKHVSNKHDTTLCNLQCMKMSMFISIKLCLCLYYDNILPYRLTFQFMRVVWKVHGLTLLLQVKTLWRCSDGLCKCLSWQVMHILQCSTHFLKMCCRSLITEISFLGAPIS